MCGSGLYYSLIFGLVFFDGEYFLGIGWFGGNIEYDVGMFWRGICLVVGFFFGFGIWILDFGY